MAQNFNTLWEKMSPKRRGEIDMKVKETLAEMPLQELRNARGLIWYFVHFKKRPAKCAYRETRQRPGRLINISI